MSLHSWLDSSTGICTFSLIPGFNTQELVGFHVTPSICFWGPNNCSLNIKYDIPSYSHLFCFWVPESKPFLSGAVADEFSFYRFWFEFFSFVSWDSSFSFWRHPTNVCFSHLSPPSFETVWMFHGRKILNVHGIILNDRPGVVPREGKLALGSPLQFRCPMSKNEPSKTDSFLHAWKYDAITLSAIYETCICFCFLIQIKIFHVIMLIIKV